MDIYIYYNKKVQKYIFRSQTKNAANKICFIAEQIPTEQDSQNIRQDGSVGIIETWISPSKLMSIILATFNRTVPNLTAVTQEIYSGVSRQLRNFISFKLRHELSVLELPSIISIPSYGVLF